MMNYVKTVEVLSRFHQECMRFWENEGKDTRLAIKDIERLEHNPYSPNGQKLNPQAKEEFLKVIKIFY